MSDVIDSQRRRTHVLVLTAGRRVELLQCFQRALQVHLPGSRVLATDSCPSHSAACQVSDGAFVAPPIGTEEHTDFLLELCAAQGIGVVIPTLDTGLLHLAQARERLAQAGVQLVVSSPALVADCRDKRRTAALFTRLGLDSPALLDRAALSFPCFVKPYDGSSSIGARRLDRASDVTPAMLANERLMFSELVGPEFREYTVDVFYDAQGRLVCLVPRERLAVRAGEISKGLTRRHFVYDALLKPLSRLEGARGCVTVQVFGNPDTGEVKGLEINPRFGGGYPLSDAAGATFADWIVREYLLGQSLSFFDAWEADLLMLRYDAKVLVRDAHRA